ncbi:MAG TPA: SPFH domain-containing protein [Anaerolineae bacterium]|nr:SPFH domain-containing protein [Anaerolineae bacterium]
MNNSKGSAASKIIGYGLAAVVILVVVLVLANNFFYFLKVVESQEVGIQFRGGRIHNVVGPGVYSDIGLFVRLETISTQAIPFHVEDKEIITKDKQRIGLVVSGDIFRPGLDKGEMLLNSWNEYRGIYIDDDLALNRVADLAKQAMKVCVGDRTFDDNIIGASRDALRNCIDDELNDMVAPMGLSVNNVVVPDVILSPEVQAALDAIVQSRLATEKAAQDQLKAQAEAAAEQAKQEGAIRVEQSKIQEQTRQQTQLAELERQRLAAQTAVIEAQRANDLAQKETERALIEVTKANELLAAQRDLEINLARAEAAKAQAQADTALQTLLGELYAQYPAYVQLLIAQANASALTATDKIIFTPEGSTPTIVVPGPGIMPTVETTP